MSDLTSEEMAAGKRLLAELKDESGIGFRMWNEEVCSYDERATAIKAAITISCAALERDKTELERQLQFAAAGISAGVEGRGNLNGDRQ